MTNLQKLIASNEDPAMIEAMAVLGYTWDYVAKQWIKPVAAGLG